MQGTVAEAQQTFIGKLPQRALTEKQEQALKDSLAAVGLLHLLTLQGLQDRAFLEAVGKVYDRARREGWEASRYRGEVLKVAERFGFKAGSFGPLAATWLFTAVLSPLYELGRHNVLQQYQQVFPYLMYWTRDDDKVRPNHFALHGFVARADWDGWQREVLPPQGWGCRCRVIEIPWTVAQRLNWQGVFPLGVEKLLAYRALGGADAGFPRERFVSGAVVPKAA